MRQFIRLPSPQYLTENWVKWGNHYAQKKTENSSHTFNWVTHKKQKLNQKILPFLIEQTQQHCSYCDAYPMKISDDTIDHFKPKGIPQFYHLAFHWENLYYCCADCQKSKWEQFDDALLRPDEADFSFSRYFIMNFSTGEIQPNPTSNDDEKRRSIMTIKILGLNHTGQCKSRVHAIKRFSTDENPDLEDFHFRFMFD